MWKDLVGTVAPAIATALGGPLAGLAVGALGNALGFENASEQDIETALQHPTNDQLLALKNAELKFKAELKKLDVDLARINASDRDSARKRESATGDVWTNRILATVTMLAFIGCVVFVFYAQLTGMDPAQIALIGGVIGYASAKADTVIAYYFGSSQGSKDKDTLLFNSAPNS